jgi:uncharacterized ion transporter superfamily protein YfcC
MEHKAGAQISQKAFMQSLLILLLLMALAGVLTRVVTPGRYDRVMEGERELVDPDSFRTVERPDYPLWRWFTAPVEVLWGNDGLTVIIIILFLLMVGGAFAVLDRSDILKAAIARVVARLGTHKYALLLVVTLCFMVLGAFFGIFEEVVPLVPVMIALSYFLGWDSLVGLGMSILATNMGFSAAIMNPFSIGVAQEIADLPLFSGAWLRVLIFLAIYAVLALFLVRYARQIERDPSSSPVFEADCAEREKYAATVLDDLAAAHPRLGRAVAWFFGSFLLILLVLLGGAFLPGLSQFALPLVGVLFLLGGVGAGRMAGLKGRALLRALGQGVAGIAPGIPLILMAASVKHIIAQGSIMDTLLHGAAGAFAQASPFLAAVLVYALALFIELFIGSASAKAFLIMPIVVPLADLIGVTRQVAVTAYCFGDGFSNLIYPTNPVLLITLGLTVVSYTQWLKWTLKLWAWVLPVTLAFLGLAVAINFGPF